MHPDKEGINRIVDILIEKGVKKFIISPGSRNAPLIKAFTNHPQAECYSVIDERSAAYFAMGIALKEQNPVAIICTSGTAVLNYAPAIAEAYYQQIPLIAITADRPEEMIDQREGQAIRQANIYHNYIKASCQFPQEPYDANRLWHGDRMVSEMVNKAKQQPCGPIHINVPLREPLYNDGDYKEKNHKIIHTVTTKKSLSEETINELAKQWNAFDKKMILTGVLHPDKELDNTLSNIAQDKSVAVLTERLSNLSIGNYHHNIDRLLNAIPTSEKHKYAPQLLITIGTDVVSKQIKQFLRTHKPDQHWHIDISGNHTDTYKSLTHIIPVTPKTFFTQIVDKITPGKIDYYNMWNTLNDIEKHNTFLQNAPWSDFKVFGKLLPQIPTNSVIHLGNSTPVRYAMLFEERKDVEWYANRGTSGIDGIISTAAGFASASKKINTVISGDVSFFYDSNALWNKHLPNNLKIIVINNQGGSIFRIIPGPASTGQLEDYFQTKQELNIKKMAEVFDLNYYFCDEKDNFNDVIKKVYQPHNKAVVLEIRTSGELNDIVLKNYFDNIKQL